MTLTILTAAIERFPIAGIFAISRGSKTVAEVIHVTLTREGMTGHGECVPYARYGETADGTLATIIALQDRIAGGLTRQELQTTLPPGAARNALDCAFWDLEAKLARSSVARLAGLAVPETVLTAYTISLASPHDMAEAARKATGFDLLKLKLGGENDVERITAIRKAAPAARLIVDANESWGEVNIARNLAACADFGVELVEQPLAAQNDAALASLLRLVPVCADESVHGRTSMADLPTRYDAINIKLDKTGGLTEAIELARMAKAQGLRIMVGCMVGTSLSMAPALLLSGLADWVDLDGPLLLQSDRPDGLTYDRGLICPTHTAIWG